LDRAHRADLAVRRRDPPGPAFARQGGGGADRFQQGAAAVLPGLSDNAADARALRGLCVRL
ncbi:MAG: hypothetical protein ACXV5L_04230, partial [Thermoanaerobaculia bacterium]